jgi:hypothetical protein
MHFQQVYRKESTMRRKMRNTIVVGAAVVLMAMITGSAQATEHDEPLPPDGARAVVQVTPNPTTERGQQIEITGHCGGGDGLRAVLGGFPDNPILTDIQIIDPDPEGFRATARLVDTVGNGVGPVFVDCGTQLGVTLLVTHV